jgi:hypothetical protein
MRGAIPPLSQYAFMAWCSVEAQGQFYVYLLLNSPTVTHACRKRRLKWVATLLLGGINTEAWSSGMGVGRGANNPTLYKENC